MGAGRGTGNISLDALKLRCKPVERIHHEIADCHVFVLLALILFFRWLSGFIMREPVVTLSAVTMHTGMAPPLTIHHERASCHPERSEGSKDANLSSGFISRR